MSNTDASTKPKDQPVIFTTQTQYPLPAQKFLIPSTWKRYQLSQLVNKALGLDSPVPFDFLVRGEVLRASLEEWCAERGVGEEETLEIEYVESVLPPKKMSDFPHEDWVSDVSCSIPGYILTASYDGQIRVFDYSQNLIVASTIHNDPITSLSVFSSSASSSTDMDTDDVKTYTIYTSSHDMTARITKLSIPSSSSNPSAPSSSASASAATLASLHLHTAPVSSIVTSHDGKHLLTSSWDGLIALWDTAIPERDEVPLSSSAFSNGVDPQRKKTKKRRMDVDGADDDLNSSGAIAAATVGVKRKAPVRTFKSHTARVSKVVFADASAGDALSCGFDSTVRLWDVEMGVCKHTISASEKPFLDIAPLSSSSSSSSPHLAVATSTDRTMTLYDLRTSASAPSISSFVHPATPSCIALPPSSSTTPATSTTQHQVMTASYDSIVRLWDLRSKKSPLSAFKAFDDQDGTKKKILGLDWTGGNGGIVGIGGEGGLSVWKVGKSA